MVVLSPADFKVAEEQLELPAAEVYRQLAAQGSRKHLLQIPKVCSPHSPALSTKMHLQQLERGGVARQSRLLGCEMAVVVMLVVKAACNTHD